jgi:DNA-binding transcriptional ArsR family regulator
VIDRELFPLVAARFKALADEGRLSLLAALQRGERSVGELVAATGRSQPNVSQHLASLTHAGLVEARRDGTRAFYRIADPTVLRICDAVCAGLAGRARGGWPAVRPGRRKRARGER